MKILFKSLARIPGCQRSCRPAELEAALYAGFIPQQYFLKRLAGPSTALPIYENLENQSKSPRLYRKVMYLYKVYSELRVVREDTVDF